MSRRWLVYLVIGVLFGLLDAAWRALPLNAQGQPAFGTVGQAVTWAAADTGLNFAVWLLPAVPVAVYEARHSLSRRRAALASLSVWCAAVIAYYSIPVVQFAFVGGRPGLEDLHLSYYRSPYFWTNWAGVLRADVLQSIGQWLPLAVAAGASVGFLSSTLYLRLRTVLGMPSALSGRRSSQEGWSSPNS